MAEIERRKMGQDLNKLKDFKAEREAKETRESIRKEKEETRLAREKVREQIQRDRSATATNTTPSYPLLHIVLIPHMHTFTVLYSTTLASPT